AAMEDVVGPQRYLDAGTADVYREIRRRGYDAAQALDAMDQEGLDLAVVFRTFAHMTVSLDGLDPPFASALCRAFNDWLADYCAANAARLRPSALVSLHDPQLAA